jgi:hypothetical protein
VYSLGLPDVRIGGVTVPGTIISLPLEETLAMSSWTPEDAQQYLERWRLVEEQEISDLQNTPMETKARQLAALMASWELFGEDPEREKGIREVRARWA